MMIYWSICIRKKSPIQNITVIVNLLRTLHCSNPKDRNLNLPAFSKKTVLRYNKWFASGISQHMLQFFFWMSAVKLQQKEAWSYNLVAVA
jgi:hypothetical protein